MKYRLQICLAACCALWEYSWARSGNSILERISIFVIMLACVCPSLEQTCNFHRRICLPSFGQAKRWATDGPRKLVSVQVKGNLLLRWAEEEMGTFPREARNQTGSEPDLAGSLRQDAHQDQNYTVILQIGRAEKTLSFNSSSSPQMGGSRQLLPISCQALYLSTTSCGVQQGATEWRSLITQPIEIH